MAKQIALKAFRGLEGPVRVGQVLDPAEHPTLTRERIAQLTRNRLIGPYSDKMAAAPRNQAVASPAEPIGVHSPNAGGMKELRWDPDEAHRNRVRAIGEPDDEGAEGNGEASTEAAPDGSSTPPIGSESFSRPDRPQKEPAKSSGARKPRGRRAAS